MNTELQSQVLSLLNKYQVNPQERFSQNFLVDKKARDSIIASVPFDQSQEIVEIGPGLGSLTSELIKKGKHVTAIEFDRDMVKVLNGEHQESNFALIQGDFLRQDLNMFHVKHTSYIGNLPYSISRDILHKVLVDSDYIYFGFMVQKELGDKLFYKEGSSMNNPFSVYFALRGDLSEVGEFKAGSFYPPPKISSDFLAFRPSDNGVFASEKIFSLIQALFLNPRKNLNNNLRSSTEFGYLLSHLEKIAIPATLRPHQLTISQIKSIISEMEK